MKICPKCDAECPSAARFCVQCGTNLRFLDPPPTGQLAGTTVAGSFLLEDQIGSGAMGAIYRATQLSLAKTVVVKLLHRHLLTDPTISRRFHREARAASRLDHPNIITVIDFGQSDDGALFIAMEHVDGKDLAEVIHESHPLGVTRIVRILKQVCLALDEAHVKGIIHRDLKPENIMIEQRRNDPDFVKVLDFGIAKIQDAGEDGDKPAWQTVAGVVCGTPEYMAPEQARGDPLDARCDLYALGVILYQMLTNTLPFVGDSPIAVVTRHLVDPLPTPSARSANVDPRLEALVKRLMAKKREDRPASAMAVFRQLERIEAGQAEASSPPEPHEDATRLVPPERVDEVARDGPPTAELSAGARSPWRWLGAGAVIVFAALTAVAWGLLQQGAEVPRVFPGPARAAVETGNDVDIAQAPEPRPPSVQRPVRAAEPADWLAGGPVRRGPEAAPPLRPAEVADAQPIEAPARARTRPRAVARQSKGAVARQAREEKAAAARRAKEERAAALAEVLQEARDAKASGQWGRVIAAYSEAYRLRPSAGYLKELGRAHIKAGDRTRGCDYLSRYLKRLSPDKRAVDMQTLSFYRCDFSG